MIKQFTHAGWFGVVPIFAADVNTDEPTLIGRLPYSDWAVSAMARVFQGIAYVAEVINPDSELGFPIWVEELDTPISQEVGQ